MEKENTLLHLFRAMQLGHLRTRNQIKLFTLLLLGCELSKTGYVVVTIPTLADVLQVTRQTVYRILKEFERMEWIRSEKQDWYHRKIYITQRFYEETKSPPAPTYFV